jgi:rod shape-determining protein MreC
VIGLVVLSLASALLDSQMPIMQRARSALMTLLTPVYWVADASREVSGLGTNWFATREFLIKENNVLHGKVLTMEGRLQQLVYFRSENSRLRQLLNSSIILQDDLLVAEVVGFSPSQFNHFILLNKGERDGVYIGQSVLDANGLLGQITEVTPLTSKVLLITDSSHGVPLQVIRSGVRGIGEGIGRNDQIDIMQVPLNSDVEVGDVLVSSGLARRFPAGYPVAKISKVNRSDNQFFAEIKATPLAKMNRSRHVLLVFAKQKR